MARKLPPDAFDYYFALGPARSYQAVAEKYGVTKRSVTYLGKRERWQARIEELHAKARQAASEKELESLEEMNQRHLKLLQAIEGRAFQALKSLPLDTAIAAVRALDIAIKQERSIRGEPGEGSGESIEETIRREYQRWMLGGESAASAARPETEDGDGAHDPARAAE